jgi:hypothetical protein
MKTRKAGVPSRFWPTRLGRKENALQILDFGFKQILFKFKLFLNGFEF